MSNEGKTKNNTIFLTKLYDRDKSTILNTK